ncbi:hypothetical protein R615_07770 [Thalassolituus oleivorans R6-15]|uniref:Uncharacterized protein n=1 Tax=Thalassolituus oleivorans MIL-1 TaxID=1298593 RepID=M5DT64_9GAMM|nr:hypothetical protein R615_07770 [Thalassolituus oleivorans R6-15]CCU72402.1 hypothetical protein TOL_1993 [Thalassolituus oleivorans MIL-1]
MVAKSAPIESELHYLFIGCSTYALIGTVKKPKVSKSLSVPKAKLHSLLTCQNDFRGFDSLQRYPLSLHPV